ncbi:MAG: hypothetical protein AAGH15_18425 [Myxococcota bacterium]
MNETYSLTFCLVDDFDEDSVMRVRLLVGHVGKKGRWPVGRPSFFDEVDADSATRPDDVPIRVVGGAVPLRRPGPSLSHRHDREDFERASTVVQRLTEFAKVVGVAFELYLGGQYVGRVQPDGPDRLVAEGLLGEWERSLRAKGDS